MKTIEDGDTLPALTLAAPDGSRVTLVDHMGKPLVMYFYPKDDSPGCTREAQDFSDLHSDFAGLGVSVLGISRDTPAKHLKFIAKHALAIPLATDDTEEVVQAFGVWVEKSLYGKRYMGIDRATFLFDSMGVLVRSWRKVRVPGHAAEVLAAARALS